MTQHPAYPGPLAALLLTLLAWSLVALVASLALSWATPTAALGIGVTVGVGGVGLLAASWVPPPQAERMGLRGLRSDQLLPLLLLVPSLLLVSEVDNCIRVFAPPPDAPALAERAQERIPTGTALGLLETLVVVAGLVPIAEEWLFRGVLQQGLVARFGRVGGLTATAALFAFGHGSLGISAAAWLALTGSAFCSGLVLGVVRLATGSLLAAMLLHASMNAAATLALALAERVPVPGFNAPGAHTPLAVLLLAAASVGLGLVLLKRAMPRDPPPRNGKPADCGRDDTPVP